MTPASMPVLSAHDLDTERAARTEQLLPSRFAHLDVFIGPLAAVEAEIASIYDAQAILCGWRPSRAAVIGCGARALLTALALRLRGLEVTMFREGTATGPECALVAAIGARCASESFFATSDVFDITVHARALRAQNIRGILAARATMARHADRRHVDAARQTVIAAETRYSGWLTRLSRET